MCLAETADGCWGHERRYWRHQRQPRHRRVGLLPLPGRRRGDQPRHQRHEPRRARARTSRPLHPASPRHPRQVPAGRVLPCRPSSAGTRRRRRPRCRPATPPVTRNMYFVDTDRLVARRRLSDTVHPNDAGHRPSPTGSPRSSATTDRLRPRPPPAHRPPPAPTAPVAAACAITYGRTGDWGTGAQFDVTHPQHLGRGRSTAGR